MKLTVIISYRRDDTGAITGRICDRLRARFGDDRVYMDIDSNPIGVDYRAHIDESLKRCDILLAVIGPEWLGLGDVGTRRIDDPADLVRLEVTSALTRGIRVVPLLIDDTEMPSSQELPEDLKALKFRQAFRVDSGIDFHHHLDRLCSAIEAASRKVVEAINSQPPPLASKPTPTPEKGVFLHHLNRLLAAIPVASPSAARTTGPPTTVPPIPPRAPASTKRDGLRDTTVPRSNEPGALPGRESEKRRVSRQAIAALICLISSPLIGFLLAGFGHVRGGSLLVPMFGLGGAAIVYGYLARKEIRQNPSLAGDIPAIVAMALGCMWLVFLIVVGLAISRDPGWRTEHNSDRYDSP